MTKITDIDQLIEIYRDVFFLPDDGIIPLVCAVIIANRMPGDPVWLMLVGPSSSGKSELINATLDVEFEGLDGERSKFVHQVSTLTANTFLSGMERGGKETSLLHQIGSSGIIAMKDFTSIITLGPDTQQAVVGQMREIYDGHMVKKTGTGKENEWKGKLGLLGGVTEGIYTVEDKFSEMGSRWINYVLKEQSREKTALRSLDNDGYMKKKRADIKEAFASYLEHMINNIPSKRIELSEDLKKDIVKVANFATVARSPSHRNYRGEMELTISSEFPMRMAKQLSMLARVFTFMRDGEITETDKETLFKIARDSIPKGKRMALEVLTKYDRVYTRGVATELNYPTKTVRIWLEDLNVRNICTREKGTGLDDMWELNDWAREFCSEYTPYTQEGGELAAEEEDLQETISPFYQEYQEEMNHDQQRAQEIQEENVSEEFDALADELSDDDDKEEDEDEDEEDNN